ncbi:MAG: carboxypeptidase-like regulatory domain-containing protein [Fuerstiella sp.]
MLTRLLTVSLLSVAMFASAGCGGTDFGEIGQITGKITFRGEVVETGTKVIFMKMDKGYAGYAFTDAEGKYKIEWRRDGSTYDGLPVGSYSVLVEPPGAIDVEELSAEEMLDGKDNVAPVKPQFDKKYTQTATSGLKYDVVAGENMIDITLD